MDEPPIMEFFERGLVFIGSAKENGGSDPSVALTLEDAEWLEWGSYFMDRYGRVPVTFRDVEKAGKGSFTVPTKQPKHLDQTWVPGSGRPYHPVKPVGSLAPRTDAERAMADRLVEVFKKGLSGEEF